MKKEDAINKIQTEKLNLDEHTAVPFRKDASHRIDYQASTSPPHHPPLFCSIVCMVTQCLLFYVGSRIFRRLFYFLHRALESRHTINIHVFISQNM